MTFAEAMDAIGATAVELSEVMGMAPQTIRQMRMDPGNVNYREPPPSWRSMLADYARRRGGELEALADKLEREGRRR